MSGMESASSLGVAGLGSQHESRPSHEAADPTAIHSAAGSSAEIFTFCARSLRGLGRQDLQLPTCPFPVPLPLLRRPLRRRRGRIAGSFLTGTCDDATAAACFNVIQACSCGRYSGIRFQNASSTPYPPDLHQTSRSRDRPTTASRVQSVVPGAAGDFLNWWIAAFASWIPQPKPCTGQTWSVFGCQVEGWALRVLPVLQAILGESTPCSPRDVLEG